MWRWLLVVFILGWCVTDGSAQDMPSAGDLIAADASITNVLLIGSATSNGAHNPGLTDTLMLISLHHDSGHLALLSIPRDLWVYVPQMDDHVKINQVYYMAERAEAGSGIDALYAVIRHNLGVTVDHYARVDFESFPQLVDAFGGIRITVDCTIEDWRLIEPDLDKQDPDNWEMFTLWSGLYHMDGDTALWYVRSRRTSNDLDRNRRQQDVLRALWRQIRADGLLENAPRLWEQVSAIVETDVTFQEMVALLPLLADLDPAQIEYYGFRIRHEVEEDYSPDEGRYILVAQPDAVAALMRQVIAPSGARRLNMTPPRVAIYNGSGRADLDDIAAQRLEREGFLTTIIDDPVHPRQYNLIVDHTGASRHNPVTEIQRVLRVTDDGVQTDPQPARGYDYAVYIGWRYQYMSCTYPVQQPQRSADE